MQLAEKKASIERLLQEMGAPMQFQDTPGSDGSIVWTSQVFYQGIPVGVSLYHNSAVLSINACLGTLPREALVPLYRQLLAKNHGAVGHQFSIDERTNNVHMMCNVAIKQINENFDAWFREWFQGFIAAVYQSGMPVQRQFGLGTA